MCSRAAAIASGWGKYPTRAGSQFATVQLICLWHYSLVVIMTYLGLSSIIARQCALLCRLSDALRSLQPLDACMSKSQDNKAWQHMTAVGCNFAAWFKSQHKLTANSDCARLLSDRCLLPRLLLTMQPPKEFSTAQQQCRILMTVQAKPYISTGTYPCSMTPSPFEQLGRGCCYDPPTRH